MRVLDILNSAWAIEPGKLAQIQEIYMRRVLGERVDMEAVREAIKMRAGEDDEDFGGLGGYKVFNNVAVLPVIGLLSKHANFMSMMSGGGTSMQILQRDFSRAMNDPTVRSIVLLVDSPGGTVDGCQTTSNLIREARGKGKPIVTLADSQMCSAAYWIGSAADRIVVADETTIVGSIGVVAMHTDVSKKDAMEGKKITEITAGKYKRVVSAHEPLSKAGYDHLQEQANDIYTVFVNDVALNRGVDVDTVLEKMAEGRVFMGPKAADVGLIDGMGSLDDLILELSGMSKGSARAAAAIAASPQPPKGEAMSDSKDKTTAEAGAAATAAAATTVDTPEKTDVVDDGKPKEKKTDEPVDEPVKKDETEDAESEDTAAAPVQTSAPAAAPALVAGDAKPNKEATGGNRSMAFDARVKELLGLPTDASDETVETNLRAARATNDVVVANGDQFVSLLSFNVLKEENRKLGHALSDAEQEKSRLIGEHEKKQTESVAMAEFQKAVDDKKISPALHEWAKAFALRDIEGFREYAAKSHRVLSFDQGKGSNSDEPVVTSAAELFNKGVEALLERHEKKGQSITIGKAQELFAKENPAIYAQYQEDMRGVRS